MFNCLFYISFWQTNAGISKIKYLAFSTFIHSLNISTTPFPLHFVQGNLSFARPLPLHAAQTAFPELCTIPFPRHTMQETLAPNGFLPVPEQKVHFISGFSISTAPVPWQTRQKDSSENSPK